VRYELESASELEADGWFANSSGAPTSFADGQMIVPSDGYNEWILYNDPDSPTRWWNYVSAAKGWWIEARLQIAVGPDSATCFDGGPGLWVHDGNSLLKLTFTSTEARISYPMLMPMAVDPTDGLHTYRLQNLGGRHFQVLVDGEQQLDFELTNGGGGTEGITMGDLGGCGPSNAMWEYLAYDTAAPGTETEDVDGDGIEAAVDLCPDLADPEQLDSDADRQGDACDSCPNDPLNDADADGLCADEDICPQSPDNTDSNANGICDSEECLNGGVPVAAYGGSAPPVAIAAPCFPGMAPNCCPFYGIDPVLPPPGGGAAGTAGASNGSGGVGQGNGGTGNGGTNGGANNGAGASTGGSTANTHAGSGNANAGSDVTQQAGNTNSSGTCTVVHRSPATSGWSLALLLASAWLAGHRRHRSRSFQ
jgi:hypothetical protein